MESHDKAIVRPCFAFGLSRDVRGNVAHLEGNKVLFPVGHLFAMYDPSDTQTAFFPAHDVPAIITCMAISPNRKYLATVEAAEADTMQVSVYNLQSERRVRSLPVPSQHTSSREVVAISFSGDGKLLTMACGSPDWTVVVWKWYSGKVAALVDPELPLTLLASNPWEEAVLAVAAPEGARLVRLDMGAGIAKPGGLVAAQDLDAAGGAVTALTWVVGQALVLGTSSGALAVVQDGAVSWTSRLLQRPNSPAAAKARAAAATAAAMASALRGSEGGRGGGSTAGGVSGGGAAPLVETWWGVQQLAARGRGFVVAGGYGEVWVYDPAGDGLSKRHTATEMFVVTHQLAADCPAVALRGLSVSPGEDHLALTTATGQLLLADLSSAAVAAAAAAAEAGVGLDEAARSALAEADQVLSTGMAVTGGAGEDEGDLDPRPFTAVAGCFPEGRLVAMDAIVHPPLLLAITETRVLHLWDWLRRSSCVAAPLLEEALCCALHPGGTMALVGSNDQLRMYQLLRGDLCVLAELPVRKCTLARYSPGGHLFAAVGRNNSIIIYPAHPGSAGAPGASLHASSQLQTLSGTSTLAGGGGMTPLAVLKAHVSTVTDMGFSRDGVHLVSVGAGGAVYWWEVGSGARLMEFEYVDKACVYTSVCYSDRHKGALVRTLDGRLQHISGGRLRHEVSGLGQDYAPMVLAGEGRLLLVGSSSGSLFVLPWPKEVPHDEVPPTSMVLDRQLAARPATARSKLLAVGGESFSSTTPRPRSPRRQSGMSFNNSHPLGSEALSDSPRSSSPGYTSPGTPRTPGARGWAPWSGGSMDAGATGTATPTGSQALQASSGSSSGNAPQEFWLHAGRVDCIKMLGSQGVVFTAGMDGVILMSLVTLMLDDTFHDPPALQVVTAMASARRESTSGSGAGGLSSMRLGPDAGSSVPLQVALVPEATIQRFGERLRESAGRLAAVKKEAGFQLMRQTLVHRDKLSVVEAELSATRQQLAALKQEFEEYKAEAQAHEQQVVMELEALHSSAADELSALYEARLALEGERLAQALAARDDAVAAGREQHLRATSTAAKQLEELHVSYRQQLLEADRRYAALKVASAEAEAAWEEMVSQAEADLEAQAERDGAKLAQMGHDLGENLTKLKAEVHLLKRNNLRLKADKAADLQKMEELVGGAKALRQQLADAKVTADKLRAEVKERDAVISDNYNTLQALRRRCQELETHKFVLGYKAEQYQKQLAPAEEQVAALNATLAAQDKELLGRQQALSAVQRTATDREGTVRRLQGEVWSHKQRADKLQARLDTFAHELWQVMQQPEDTKVGGRTRRAAALEGLASKYCGPRAPLPPTGPEVEGELQRHVMLVERRADVLTYEVEQARLTGQQQARRLLQQNAVLLKELGQVQHINKELGDKLAAAGEAAQQLAEASSGGSGAQTSSSSRPGSGTTGAGGGGGSPGGKGQQLEAGRGKAGSSSSGSDSPAKGRLVTGSSKSPTKQATGSTSAAAAGDDTKMLTSPYGRTIGVHAKSGAIQSASTGRVLAATVAAGRGQLGVLQSALAASQQVVAAQAAMLTKLQRALTEAPTSGSSRPGSPARASTVTATLTMRAAALDRASSPSGTTARFAGALQLSAGAQTLGDLPEGSKGGGSGKLGSDRLGSIRSPSPSGGRRSPSPSSSANKSRSTSPAGAGIQAAVKQDMQSWRSRRA